MHIVSICSGDRLFAILVSQCPLHQKISDDVELHGFGVLNMLEKKLTLHSSQVSCKMHKILMILLGIGAFVLVSGNRMTGFHLVACGVDHGTVKVIFFCCWVDVPSKII
jgi:hypothetical protein